MALPGLAWVEIEAPAMEEDGWLKVFNVPETIRHVFNLMTFAVKTFAQRVRHSMAVIGHHVVDVSVDGCDHLANRRQLTMSRPKVPLLLKLPAKSGVE